MVLQGFYCVFYGESWLGACLPVQYQSYTEAYRNSRVMAPSCLLYYVGLNKRLTSIRHHSLFFDTSFETDAAEIYTDKREKIEIEKEIQADFNNALSGVMHLPVKARFGVYIAYKYYLLLFTKIRR